MSFSTVGEVVDFLFESFNLAGLPSGPDALLRRPDLTRKLLVAAGCLETDLPAAVVTGSKGKGSTAVFTARVAQAAGHRVGLITSPHLRDFRERIRLDGRAIPTDAFLAIANELAPAIRGLTSSLRPPVYLGPNGIVLAIGLLYFRQAGATVLVIEAGRGGAHDDANLAPHRVAVLTPIYAEHIEQLGPTITEIAGHKAGIISAGGLAVAGRQPAAARAVIEARAAAVDARLLHLGEAVRLDLTVPGRATVATPNAVYSDLPVALLGRHQADNLAVALAAAEDLAPGLPNIDRPRFRAALATVRWPGRVDIVAERPLVILDAAVTEESAHLAIEAIRDRLRRPVVGVVAVPDGKDLLGVCRALTSIADSIVLTRTRRNRTLRYSPSAETAARAIGPISTAADLPAAMAVARDTAGQEGSILIFGTISLLAETYDLLDRDSLDLWSS